MFEYDFINYHKIRHTTGIGVILNDVNQKLFLNRYNYGLENKSSFCINKNVISR